MTTTLPDSSPDELEDEPERGPLRRCLVTRQQGPREAMLRFVAGPDRQLVFDASATLPGRGMWLSASADVIDLAVRRGVFPRAAKMQLTVPPNLASVVRAALERRVAELLGLTRRGGAAISGFEKAREWLQAGKAGLVVQATDGSPDERARFVGNRMVPVVAVLSAAALGKIFGREHTVHVVLAPGRLAGMIENEARRLEGVADKVLSGQ
ncbi:MAG: RNA-binding protein [Acidocella sp.]|nr:RNA-binding protein [Acidocella sp.]